MNRLTDSVLLAIVLRKMGGTLEIRESEINEVLVEPERFRVIQSYQPGRGLYLYDLWDRDRPRTVDIRVVDDQPALAAPRLALPAPGGGQ